MKPISQSNSRRNPRTVALDIPVQYGVLAAVIMSLAVHGLFASMPLFVVEAQTRNGQATRTPDALKILEDARRTLRGEMKDERGLQLEGNVLSSNPSAPEESFIAHTYSDGFTFDATAASGKIFHTESRGDQAQHRRDNSPVAPRASDSWSPRLDYFPLHGWWTEFENPATTVILLTDGLTVGGEACDHVHLILPPPNQFQKVHVLHRVEDVYVGESSHLVRRISYELPAGANLLRTETVTLDYRDYQTIDRIPVPTHISRSINGLSAGSIVIKRSSLLTTQSMRQEK